MIAMVACFFKRVQRDNLCLLYRSPLCLECFLLCPCFLQTPNDIISLLHPVCLERFLLYPCVPLATQRQILFHCILFCLESLFFLYNVFCARSANNIFIPLFVWTDFVVLFFCARSAQNIFTLLYPFLLGKLFAVPICCACAVRRKRIFYCAHVCLESFLLYIFVGARHEEHLYFIAPLF